MADRENVIRDLRYVKSFGRVSNNPQLTEIAESALELLKEQQPKTGHWVAKSNVSWHENGDDDATPVFYATFSCSECGKPYRYDVAHTFVDYDEWSLAYVPNGPVLNDRRIPIYNKAFEEHKKTLKSFLSEWISCPYCGAKMEKQL